MSMSTKRPREDFESGRAPAPDAAPALALAPSALDFEHDALQGLVASHRRLCELRRRVELEPPLAGQAPTAACVRVCV